MGHSLCWTNVTIMMGVEQQVNSVYVYTCIDLILHDGTFTILAIFSSRCIGGARIAL
jgi:cobalamin biosynthesis Co2+ chelatase CbiK